MIDKRHDIIELELYFHHETEGAILVSVDGNRSKAEWLPKGMIEFEPWPESFVGKGPHLITVQVPEWKAQERGLI